MILIADSGSTKSDWLYFNRDHTSETITTLGFNPFFHSSETISEEISKCAALTKIADQITHIYFFGAGCSSPERNEIVAKGLALQFARAEIRVDHDLLGAAIAACGSNEGIACILGTGSNSCFYDGKNVYEEVPSLGYILGDEGGGDSMGRQLLSKFLYKQLPDYLDHKFRNELHLNKEKIFDAIYHKPNPNVFMASLMKEIQEFNKEPWVQQFVSDNLRSFLEIHVCCFENYQKVPVNFIGSIAFHFQDLLKKEAAALEIQVGAIRKKPIDPLKDHFYFIHYDSG